MVRSCPRCNVNMKLEMRLNVEIDKCPQCKGIWFDANELDKLSGGKALEGLIFTAHPLGKELQCPACKDTMHFVTVEGVTIDTCPSCEGVWMDEGEMKKLRIQIPESQFTEENAPYEVQKKDEGGNKIIGAFKKLFKKD